MDNKENNVINNENMNNHMINKANNDNMRSAMKRHKSLPPRERRKTGVAFVEGK